MALVLACGPELEPPGESADGTGSGGEAPYGGILRIAGTQLLDIDPATGASSTICDLAGLGDEGTQSLAFTRDGRLMATYAMDELWEIDPCGCTASAVGAVGWSGLAGMTPDDGNGLWAVASEEDTLIRIDPDTGVGTAIGALGMDVANQGATWSEDDQQLYVLLGSQPAEVYTANPQTGALSFLSSVGIFYTSVGFEYHPGTEQLFACTGDGILNVIDPVTGTASAVGSTGYEACDNLAVPPVPAAIDCLP